MDRIIMMLRLRDMREEDIMVYIGNGMDEMGCPLGVGRHFGEQS